MIKESVKEVLSKNKQVLSESSLNRVIYWIQNNEFHRYVNPNSISQTVFFFN